MLEKLGNALKSITHRIAKAVFLDKREVEEITAELKRALLEADVDIALVNELCEKIKTEAKKKIRGIEKKEHLVKLLHDEIIKLIGKEKYELVIKKPSKIMFLGLYGCGKSTTIAKLALYYSKRGYKTCMLGLDVHRPAAPEQLEQLGKKAKIPVFINKKEKNPLSIYKQFSKEISKYDLCLIDTAGRSALDKKLKEEIKSLERTIKPEQVILVVPADLGKAAKKQAAEFQKTCAIKGVIVTRMDGTAKAGGALTACSETKAKILFLGTGEKLHDIETFSPVSFVGRMLGMGDLQALIEKIKLAEIPKKRVKEIEEGKFTLLDFYEQIKSMQKMGPLGKIAELIPGLGKIKLPEGMLEGQEEKIKRWEYCISSMTAGEINNPEIITGSRVERIAKGSNVSAADVREMLKQYKLIKGFVASGKQFDMSSLESLQKGKLPAGLSQKQLRKLAKKYKKVF